MDDQMKAVMDQKVLSPAERTRLRAERAARRELADDKRKRERADEIAGKK